MWCLVCVTHRCTLKDGGNIQSRAKDWVPETHSMKPLDRARLVTMMRLKAFLVWIKFGGRQHEKELIRPHWKFFFTKHDHALYKNELAADQIHIAIKIWWNRFRPPNAAAMQLILEWMEVAQQQKQVDCSLCLFLQFHDFEHHLHFTCKQ